MKKNLLSTTTLANRMSDCIADHVGRAVVLSLSLALVLVVVLVAGCAHGRSTNTVAFAQDRPAILIGFPELPEHFDPLQDFGGGHGSGTKLIFSTLVEMDADTNIVPDLAQSYTISDDALGYTFKLRADAQFSNGVDVTAADVVFTFERLMGAATSLDLTCVEHVTADGDTVHITLKKPQSTFILTVSMVGIVPEHAYNKDFGLSPIGSGPYRLVQHDAGQQFILEANENYYRQVPEIKRVIFVRLGDEDTRMAAVRGGQVDITMSNPVLAAMSSMQGYHLLVADSLDNVGIVMPVVPDTGEMNQYGHPVGNNVTSDIHFRKALAYGLDRESIGRDALNGFATPAYSENDAMPWSNPENAIESDVAYAISLLEGSGWALDADGIRTKEGSRASIGLLYPAGDSMRQSVAMAAAQQARDKLGIEIITEGVSWDQLGARMFSTPVVLAWGSANPMTSYYLFHRSHAGLDDWYNPQNYRSDIVDRYLEQAVNAHTLEEAIPLFRMAQWDGATGTSMRGDCPYVFLINRSHLYWVREGLDTGRRQIHAHGDAWPLVQNLAEWKWANE
jgi:peptide/nickel transport system substrate-binding protein